MDYNIMTIAQLRQYAADNNIDLGGASRKAEIVSAIEAATTGQKLATFAENENSGENIAPPDENGTGATQAATDGAENGAAPETQADTPQNVTETITNTENPQEIITLSRVLRVIKPIMQGSDIKAIQAALIGRGFHCGPDGANGRYTANTALAVRHFQSQNGLHVSWRIEKNTAAALGVKWTGK
jgi:hypothetical protein